MFTKINQSQFIDSFRNMGRETQFSYGALCALFQYMEDIEESCGEELELDVIALCCEFTEYASFEEYNREYHNADNMEDVESMTTVIYIGKGESFLIQQY
jgi:hypothetical protein